MSFPFSSTVADMPPLTAFLFVLACSAMRARSSSRLCRARVASRSCSASALAAFSASRFAACWRCFFVSDSGAFSWGPGPESEVGGLFAPAVPRERGVERVYHMW